MLKGAGDAEEQERAAPGTPDAKKRKRGTSDGAGVPSGAGLCDDVVGNILARLPARAAVACTALSKRHRRLIRSPEFRSLHRRLAPPLPRPHVAFVARAPITRRPEQKEPVSGFVGFNVAGGGGAAAPMRSLAGRRYLNMKYVNTCNGIVLLAAIASRKKERHSADDSRCRCILWNPAIADVVQEVTVPDPPAGSKYLVLGLGYGQSSNTYKLLLCRMYSGHSRRHGFVTYQLGDPEKKQPIAVSSFGLNDGEIIRQHSLYIDGKIYLLSRKDLAIFAFDVDDDTVACIDLPAMAERDEDLRWFGFSSLMELSGRPCVAADYDQGGMAVWLLSVDHRWEQRCLIGKLRLGNGIRLFSTIGVWECGDVLVLTVEDYCHERSGYSLFLYDVTAEKMFKAKLHREVAPEWSFSLGYDLCWGYRPTLVSPSSIVGKLDDEDKERCRECSKSILKALKPVAEQDKRKGMEATLGIMCFLDFLVRIMQMLPKDLQQVVEMTMVDSDDPDISFERVPFVRHGIRERRKSRV